MKTNDKKTAHILYLMELLAKGRELYKQDTDLQNELHVSERTLGRYLEEIHELYTDIVLTEKRKKEFTDRKVTVYRVVDPRKEVAETLRFFLENDNDLSWILQLLHKHDPSVLEDVGLVQETIDRVLDREKDVFVFNSKPFELMESNRQKNIFKNLRDAVRRREYRNIDYDYEGAESYKDVKCLKIVFSENNWYLAAETDEGKFKWFRISFIDNVSYSKKNGYQKKELEKYLPFFERFENPMTLYGVEPQKAVIMAHPYIAKYFKKGMKPFFRSQTFLRENEDGSVEFSVDYTQPLEILPFVKKWAPGLEILKPRSLVDTYVEDLRKTLEIHERRTDDE